MIKNVKLLSAAVLLLAASGAYAGTDDGNVNGQGDPGVQQQGSSQQVPANSNYDSGVVSPTP